MNRVFGVLVAFLGLVLATQRPASNAAPGPWLELNSAVVVGISNASAIERNAAAMLIDEVAVRTRIRWRTAATTRGGGAAIVLARDSSVERPAGYRIRVAGNVVTVTGHDARGVLYGVGRLLRELRMGRDSVRLPADFSVSSSPRVALRGHQLGFRPKTNSYDGWTVPMWEQYLRDLVVFGCNAVELIPPRSDDAPDSPHFPLPQQQMMIEMSRLCDAYGMDVWVWYPALDRDYADPAVVDAAVAEWAGVLRRLPRLDAVFVPGGDPGHTQPKHLMALLEKQTASIRRFHPKVQMWVSPQGFTQAWMDEFVDILVREQPKWLQGVVHGPQVRLSLPKLRALVPANYPIRRYPDITHSRQCQYPVPDWDWAYSLTEAREGINPRPTQMARIFRLLQPHAIGFLTYSEGCNDDVNKTVWSALGWDPDADVTQVLREYSRYFIGEGYTDSFAQALLALERNWVGPLATNSGVMTTLAQLQEMERTASPQTKANWRVQQALYRANYDAYTHQRLRYESGLEEAALEQLRQADKTGALIAMDQAEALLRRSETHRVAADLRQRVFELAEALYQSIRMQLSVEKYGAIDVGRGANLDTIDMPLNNRVWLTQRFAEIRALSDERERRARLDAIVNWTNPGPGGFYDDLGNLTQQPHLIRTLTPQSPLRDGGGGDRGGMTRRFSRPPWWASRMSRAGALRG